MITETALGGRAAPGSGLAEAHPFLAYDLQFNSTILAFPPNITRMTPALPSWIRQFTLTGYRNVFDPDMMPDETRLYGTESLYGDWAGRVLLLAKDFACSKVIHDRKRQGDPRPYRHEPALRTNKLLRRDADPLRTGVEPTNCGLLYGSALACLLRDDDEMSGSLPSRDAALDFGSSVLRFVIDHMPRLRVIVCMGSEAWDCVARTCDVESDWQTNRDAASIVDAGRVKLVATFHPAARIARDQAVRPWNLVRQVVAA